MPDDNEIIDTQARQTAHEARLEAGRAMQAIISHERICMERSREVATSLDRIGQDLRSFIARSHESRARMHDRVDRSQNRIGETQVMVAKAFDDLRKGLIRGLSATLIMISGAFATVLWFLLTGAGPL